MITKKEKRNSKVYMRPILLPLQKKTALVKSDEKKTFNPYNATKRTEMG